MNRRPRDGHDEGDEPDATRYIPIADDGDARDETRRVPVEDEYDTGATRYVPVVDEAYDPDATQFIETVPRVDEPADDPPVYAPGYGADADEFGRSPEQEAAYEPAASAAEPARADGPRRTGLVAAVVVLAILVVVLLVALLSGGRDATDQPAPTDPVETTAPTTEPTTAPPPAPAPTSEPSPDQSSEPGSDPSGGGVLDDLSELLPSDAPTGLPSDLPSIELPDVQVPEDLGSRVGQTVDDILGGLSDAVDGLVGSGQGAGGG